MWEREWLRKKTGRGRGLQAVVGLGVPSILSCIIFEKGLVSVIKKFVLAPQRYYSLRLLF